MCDHSKNSFTIEALVRTSLGAEGSINLQGHVVSGKYHLDFANKHIVAKSSSELIDKIHRLVDLEFLEPHIVDHCIEMGCKTSCKL